MKRFEQLTGAGRAMIRRLEEKGDIYTSFVQAGSAVKQYEGSTFLDLLKPFPPSGDPGLLRVVAKLVKETPVRQSPSSRVQKTSPFHLRENLQPPRVAVSRPAEGQNLPILPAGVDSLPAKQIIQRVLDRFGQDMMTGLSDNEIRRGSILETSLSTKEKDAVQSGPPVSGGTEKREFVFDHRMLTDQNQVLSGQSQTMPGMPDPKRGVSSPPRVVSAGQGALPGIAADPGESKEKSWVGTRPKHEQAAATVITMDKDFQISGDVLKKWASPSTKEKDVVQSGPPVSGGTEKREFVFDHRMLTDQNQVLSGQLQTLPDMTDPKRGGAGPPQVVSAGQGALPGIAADPGESKETSWFGTHPKHEQAAATVITMDQDFQISGDILKKWAAPRLNESPINHPDASSHGKEHNYESRAAAESRTFTKIGSGAKKMSDPAPERPDTAIPQPPLPENQKPSSQLAQLVHKWEDRSRQSTEGHPTDGEPVHNAAENGPGPDTAKGHPPLKATVTESRDAHRIDGHGQIPADPDQAFAMSLERVLKREIRRYGMEETP